MGRGMAEKYEPEGKGDRENQRVKTQSQVMQKDSKDYTQIGTGIGTGGDDDDMQLNFDTLIRDKGCSLNLQLWRHQRRLRFLMSKITLAITRFL